MQYFNFQARVYDSEIGLEDSSPWLYALRDSATVSMPCHGGTVAVVVAAAAVVGTNPLRSVCSCGLTPLSGTGIRVDRLMGSWNAVYRADVGDGDEAMLITGLGVNLASSSWAEETATAWGVIQRCGVSFATDVGWISQGIMINESCQAYIVCDLTNQ